jgi:GDP-4-dehydro-6-deoxy-D-mannose reductase
VTRALVTGARGFAGGYLANHLAKSGVTVTGWMRSKKGSDPFFDRTIQWQEVDLLDRGAVVHALTDLNVLGTHHLLDGLRVAGVNARVLITGSSLVYRQSDRPLKEDDPIGPATPYALSKLAQEMLGRRSIQEDGQAVFLTRSFNHTGPRQNPSYAAPGFARQIALIEKGRMPAEISVGNLEASRDLHDVRDTVRAYCGILERGQPGGTYNVCSGRAFKISDVLGRLVKMSRVPLAVRVDPARQRPHDNPVLVGDPSKIERELGWKPSFPLEQTLADLLDYWRKEIE